MTLLIILPILFANILFAQSNIDSSQSFNRSISILKNFQNQTFEEVVKEFKLVHKKNYNLTSEEGLAKLNTFKNNLKLIEETNAKNLTYTYGIGPFTDLTPEEYKERHLMDSEVLKKLINSTYGNLRQLASTNSSSTYKYINWTQSYRPAQDQGNCGSCWAIATSAALEANYQISFGSYFKFSSQQLVDCETTDSGCNGGWAPNALNYVKKNGIMYDDSYPYVSGNTQSAGKCLFSSKNSNMILNSYVSCNQGSCTRDNIISMLANGPIIGVVDGYLGFQNYKGGVLNVPCREINHAVNIVGISSDSSGWYYIGRSSWGIYWGENGYFRLRFNSTTASCFLDTQGWRPVVKKTTIAPPAAPAPQCTKFYSGCKLQGTTYSLCQNQASFTSTQGKISGFTIGNATTVDLFTGVNCTGSYFSFNADAACFNEIGMSQYVNKIGSAIINWRSQSPPKGCVWVYTGCCFLSKKLQICSSVPDLSVSAYKFANQINAVRFGPGVNSVTLATSTNYYGNYFIYSGDVTCVDPSIMNKIKSIKISLVK